MAEGTVKIVVVSDGLGYKAPGQDKPGARETYITLAASRGDEIEVDKSDAERFMALGAAAEPDSPEAKAAKDPRMAGEPFGAVKIAGEHDNLPIQKLRQEALRLGAAAPADFGDEFAREHADSLVGHGPGTTTGGDDGAVSGEVPDGLDLSDAKALGRLNAAQVKALAEREGVTAESGDTKKSLVAKIVKASKASKASKS
jgi:hypothetical protein